MFGTVVGVIDMVRDSSAQDGKLPEARLSDIIGKYGWSERNEGMGAQMRDKERLIAQRERRKERTVRRQKKT